MIKKHVTLKGKNVQWLAKRIGVSHQTIYNWEHGNAKPKPSHLVSLAKTLGIPIEKLFKHFYGLGITPLPNIPIGRIVEV